MLNDYYYAECLVAKKTKGPAKLITVLFAAAIALAALSTLIAGLYGFLALILLCAAVFRVRGAMNMEYEYLFADNHFSVDRIYNKSGRKRAAEYSLEDIRIIAPENSGNIKDFDRQVKKVTDFSSGQQSAGRYAFIYQKGGVCEKVIFEPDARMIKCFKMSAPRKMSEY